jgi:hypothetical protein
MGHRFLLIANLAAVPAYASPASAIDLTGDSGGNQERQYLVAGKNKALPGQCELAAVTARAMDEASQPARLFSKGDTTRRSLMRHRARGETVLPERCPQ